MPSCQGGEHLQEKHVELWVTVRERRANGKGWVVCFIACVCACAHARGACVWHVVDGLQITCDGTELEMILLISGHF